MQDGSLMAEMEELDRAKDILCWLHGLSKAGEQGYGIPSQEALDEFNDALEDLKEAEFEQDVADILDIVKQSPEKVKGLTSMEIDNVRKIKVT